MRITGYKSVVVLVLAGGIAFWLWHATRPPSPGAATSAPQASAGPAGGSPPAVSVTAPAGATPPAAGDQPPGPAVSTTASSPSPASPPTPASAPASPSPAVPATAGAAPAGASAGSGGEMAAVRQDLGNLQFVLRDFRLALGGNPVGSNAEIVKALLGRNKKKLVMKLWEGHRLNADGELIDPWGTPYFFHQVSAEVMELRCAGPDHVMWNKDDINVQ